MLHRDVHIVECLSHNVPLLAGREAVAVWRCVVAQLYPQPGFTGQFVPQVHNGNSGVGWQILIVLSGLASKDLGCQQDREEL